MNKTNDIEKFFNSLTKIPKFDNFKASKAKQLQNELLKPVGSLGKLEEYAIWMAGWQRKIKPSIKNAHCLIFAGNHGIANKGVSAFPSEVTAQMVANFKEGGAAINQLCELAELKLKVTPLELEKPTRDFSENLAMEKEDVISAMQIGFDSVPSNCDLLVLGEMGISNTTSASALSCALFNETVESMTGIGTGLNEIQLTNKISVIKSALKLHGTKFKSTLKIALQMHWKGHGRNNAFWNRFSGDLNCSWESLGDLVAPRWPSEGPKDHPSVAKNPPRAGRARRM